MATSTAKSTNAVKKFLREKYGIVARVKSRFYSGGSSLNIEYQGGVNPKTVDADLSGTEYGSFDGMIDLYEYNHDAPCKLDGEIIKQYKYLFVRREISDDFWFRLACAYSQHTKFAFLHECITREDYERNFEKNHCGVWNWREYVKHIFRDIHLATDDLDGIEFLDFFSTGNWETGFLYEFNGRAYSTVDLPILGNKKDSVKR